MKIVKIFSVVLGLTFTSYTHSAAITDPNFFTTSDTLIGFEVFPSDTDVVPDNTALTNQYLDLGVMFSSEGAPNTLQNTDYADSSGRFGSPFRILAEKSGGGAPTSGVRYASGDLYVHQTIGLNVSDMRVDFTVPVLAFGMYVIDNDFSTARLQAFDSNSNLLETIIIPQVSEGGFAYYGIDVSGAGSAISYWILDGAGGAALDSTFIDEFSFRPVPIPAAVWLFGSGIFVMAGFRRKKSNDLNT